MMNFIDAVGNMVTGKRLMRKIWAGYTVNILPGQGYMWSIPLKNDSGTVNAVVYLPSVEDIQSSDWVVKD